MRQDGLVLENVSLRLGYRKLLTVNHHVRPGVVLTVMGPSGSGKSTLLAYVGGFLDTSFQAFGRVVLDGVDLTGVPAEDRRAGLLFQDALLFPHMSVLSNLVFAIPQRIRGRDARRRRAEEALADVGLEGAGERDPSTLSGGQKARVALARILLSEPRMLLLDEPFSGLDAPLRQQMRELVFSRARLRGLPTLLVTHDAEDADAAGGPVIRIGEE